MVNAEYQTFKPSCSGNFECQWADCSAAFKQYTNSNPHHKAFVTRVFIANLEHDEREPGIDLIEQYFEPEGIPFSILAQSPEWPALVMIEAGFVDSRLAVISYGMAASVRYCRIEHENQSEFWLAGIEGGTNQAQGAFARLHEAFEQLGIGFEHIARQWNYVGQIYDSQLVGNLRRQNYQVFNEARAAYYSNYRKIQWFPAATGIGIRGNGTTIECMAIKSSELSIVPISNPNQYNSYKYGQTVLVGDSRDGRTENQPPQFERALLLADGENARLFISGTASIIGQDTIGLNDVAEQTRVTIKNIEVLASRDNLLSLCPELTTLPDKYLYIRVYIKEQADIPMVKQICENHYGNVTMAFVQADICRADLLVEIEAELVSHAR